MEWEDWGDGIYYDPSSGEIFNANTGSATTANIGLDQSAWGTGANWTEDWGTSTGLSETDWNTLIYGNPTGTAVVGDGTTNDSTGWSSNSGTPWQTGGLSTQGFIPWLNRMLGLGGPTGTGAGAITGSDALLGANGVLGVLAALSAKPSTSTQTGTSGSTNTSSSSTDIADWFDSLQQNLGNMLANDNGLWSNLSGYMSGGTKGFTDLTPEEQLAYVNPYVNSVLTPQLTRMSEDFQRGENARQAKAGMVGAFGEERDLIERNLAGERYDKAVNEATANAYSNAFTNAQQTFGQDRAAQQWGAGATGNLFGLLKPETATSGTSGTTNTNTAKITGTDPNQFGMLSNLAAGMYNLANPPVIRG